MAAAASGERKAVFVMFQAWALTASASLSEVVFGVVRLDWRKDPN